MNLDQISIKNFILALFKRDDGERILLGSGAYEFDAELQHFAANIIANDVIEKQGTDGQLLAGQVRRCAPQSFDGFVGDASTSREDTENYRRAFIRFFQPRHFYTVVYILPDGTAIKRKNGYLTDAPAVPEQYQKSPRYHVALAFEDLNYYSYAEDQQGDETYAQTVSLQPESELTGGLVWEATPGLSLIRVGGDLSQTGTPTPTNRKAISVATGIQTITINGVSYTLDLSTNWLAKMNASQDYIYKNNGNWVIHKEIYRNTYDGTEEWVKNANRTWRAHFSAPDIIDATIAGAAVCDRFVFWLNTGGGIGVNLPVDQFGFPTSRTSIDLNCGDCPAASKTIDEWKAWLSAHPVRIYSIRLSAAETIITDATLLAQLNAIDAALSATTTEPTATTTSTDAIPAFLGTSAITASDGIVWTAETAGGAVWDEETGHATTTFTVNGLYAVNPIWTVPGPAESPLIENTTNGTSLSYLGQIPAGQSLIIDCGNQTATIAGANVKNNVRGTWQTFEPGQITIRYSGANITGPSNLKWNEVVG